MKENQAADSNNNNSYTGNKKNSKIRNDGSLSQAPFIHYECEREK